MFFRIIFGKFTLSSYSQFTRDIIVQLVDARTYLNKYLTNLQFNNHYITDRFKQIDAERKLEGKMTLLPLQKLEKGLVIDTASIRQSFRDLSHIFGKFIKISFHLCITSVFIFLDWLLCTILTNINKDGRVDFSIETQSATSINITGDSPFVPLFKSIFKHFDGEYYGKTLLTNEPCLPKPTVLSTG